ncbi:short-chain dehydrogenase [Skermanella stibiiresistens SB22]|uniref:Short-chain dehydrogenase n=1 Tax=Skermanella stibiiresistens SB22 TaxID=1385369 RepID=W9HD13_9PROT|nr:SDR family NAD(P)-dependent oxidoreductase [Skermanella stibiiresistens]EWY41783.1 short-chain dehydrogenase [Skermanella stibiiresistens SB22]
MRLDGAVALVTGAGSGIGRAIAVELSRRGAIPILLGRDVAALEGTRAGLADPARGGVLRLDLADPGSRAGIVASVMGMADRLDLLVNNAGVVEAGPVEDQDEEVWRRMIEVNLLAPMSLTRHLLPSLRASGQGRVVNIGSMFGDIAFPYFAAYSATKFGLRGWSEALRRELADQGVGVTYCAPRGTRTAAAEGFARYVQAFSMRLDPPETVAKRIVAGIAADARDVYPQGPERLFLLAQRLFPKGVDGGLRRQTIAAAKP